MAKELKVKVRREMKHKISWIGIPGSAYGVGAWRNPEQSRLRHKQAQKELIKSKTKQKPQNSIKPCLFLLLYLQHLLSTRPNPRDNFPSKPSKPDSPPLPPRPFFPSFSHPSQDPAATSESGNSITANTHAHIIAFVPHPQHTSHALQRASDFFCQHSIPYSLEPRTKTT